MAAEIRAATIPVVDDLGAIGVAPEVIHGHHHTVTLEALLRFPGVPAIYFVHDWSAWHDAPLRFPRVALYAPVDATNADRVVCEGGIPPERVRLVLNAVDLTRFRPRPPLPARPGRAAVFSNYASEANLLPDVREACRRAGLELTVIGAGVGAAATHPELLLPGYDLVFAKARCALEAMAVGAAVVLCDGRRMGPLVTSGNFDRLRPLNFGRRALAEPLSVAALLREIEHYDGEDALRVARRVREEASLESQLDQLLALYAEAVAIGSATAPDPVREAHATAVWLAQWAPQFHQLRADRDRARSAELRLADEAGARTRAEAALAELTPLRDELARARGELGDLHRATAGLHGEVARLRGELERSREAHAAELAAAHAALGEARAELGWVTATATWRWRERLVRSPALRRAWAVLRRVLRAGRR